MAPKFRVLFILNSMNWGGIGRILSDVSCRLPESVEQIFVLLENKAVYPIRGRLIVLQESRNREGPGRGHTRLQCVLRYRRILKEVKPDVVVSFHHDARTIHMLAKESLPAIRCKTIVADLGLASHYRKYLGGMRRRIYSFSVSRALRQADRIIAIAEGVRSDLIAGFGVEQNKIEVIYGSVDSGIARQMALEPVDQAWFSENSNLIALSGRLVVEKNQADLLRAFAIVRKNASSRLVLVGDGPEKANLVRLARSLGIESHVLFTGFQSNPHKFIARSSVFAFPSLFEAQGLVLIESMAVGCPVVAYDCPVGPREMLAPGTKSPSGEWRMEEARYGILVPAGNVEALAGSILKLLGDSQLRERYSCIGRERAAHFSAEEMAKKYLAVMSAVLGG